MRATKRTKYINILKYKLWLVIVLFKNTKHVYIYIKKLQTKKIISTFIKYFLPNQRFMKITLTSKP